MSISVFHLLSFRGNLCYRLSMAVLALGMVSCAIAQEGSGPAANKQCGDYVEAYKGGPSAYASYLQATSDVAKSRDAQRGVDTYSKALQASSGPSNALWLNNWCVKNPLRGYRGVEQAAG